jgi:hypothetical protein
MTYRRWTYEHINGRYERVRGREYTFPEIVRAVAADLEASQTRSIEVNDNKATVAAIAGWMAQGLASDDELEEDLDAINVDETWHDTLPDPLDDPDYVDEQEQIESLTEQRLKIAVQSLHHKLKTVKATSLLSEKEVRCGILNTIKGAWNKAFEFISDFVNKHLIKIGVALLAVGAIFLGHTIVKQIRHWFGFSTQGYDDGSPRHTNLAKTARQVRTVKSVPPEQLVAQGADEPVAKNTCRILCSNGSLKALALGVYDRFMLYPVHLIPDFNQTYTIERTINGRITTYPFQFKQERIATFETQANSYSDLCLIYTGFSGPQFKDIRSHFLKISDTDKIRGSYGEIIYRKTPWEINRPSISNIRILDQVRAEGRDYEMMIAGTAWNEKGMCGAPWMCNAPSLQGSKVIGIHGLGAGQTGSASPISQEEVECLIEVISKMTPVITTEHHTFTLQGQEESVRPYHTQHGIVDFKDGHYVPPKTSLKETPISQFMPHPRTHGPSVLKPRDKRLDITSEEFNALRLEKTNRPTPWHVPADVIDQVAQCIADKFFDPLADLTPHSLDQVINGNQNLPHTKDLGLNMKKSAGYPWTNPRGKLSYFTPRPNIPGEKILYDPNPEKSEFWTRWDRRLELAKQGTIIADSVWTDCLKDELRPLEKVASGKTRVINSPPLDSMLLHGMYLGPIRDMMMHPKMIGLPTGSALGLDPNTTWNAIAFDILESYGVFSIDYIKYDSTIGPMLFELIALACDKIYERHGDHPEWKRARRACFMEACHTLHLCGTILYEDHHANPSGWPAGWTTLFNIMVNDAISTLAYWEATGKAPSSFVEDVRALYMGDDNIQWLLNPEILDIYSRHSVLATAQRMGMTATGADKSEVVTSYDNFNELTFLKRGFQKLQNSPAILPTMDTKTIFNLLQWQRRGDLSLDVQLDTNIREALTFAAPHGPAFFHELQKNICTALQTTGLTCPSSKLGWHHIIQSTYLNN